MDHSNNFTALRWFAAGLVLYGHSFVFLDLPEPLFLGFVPLGPLGVFIFFSISGYLISQSWSSDPNLLRFIERRALRIFPGLAICVVLTIFPFGAIISQYDFWDYISHPATRGYLTNISLYITYYLPGVFEANHVPNAVNGSLWSLPAEFFMYLIVALVELVKAPRVTYVFLLIAAILGTTLWAARTSEMLVVYRTDIRQIFICGGYFLAGSAIHRFGITRYFSVANIIILGGIWSCTSPWPAIFLAYSYLFIPAAVIALGISKTWMFPKISKFDFSYGIYIYAFPIQQAIVYYYPGISLTYYLLLATPLVIVMASLSWYLVEKPALRFKPTLRSSPTLTLAS